MTSPLPPEREGKTRRRRAGEGLSIADKSYNRVPTLRSRQLRNGATPAERKMWSVVRNRQMCGIRFNRQVVIGPYICDFVARAHKLVLEIDGGQHAGSASDQARTRYLNAKGYRVLRFWNNEVLENIEGVVTLIEQALPQPLPLRREGSSL